MADYDSFEYVNLSEIDPADKTLPTDVYQLKLVKMVVEPYAPKTGPNAGVNSQRISAQFAVTNSERFAGKRVYYRFGLNKYHMQQFRKLADVTGINVNQPVDQAVAEFAATQPEFKIQILDTVIKDFVTKQPVIDAATGKPTPTNELNWREVFPV